MTVRLPRIGAKKAIKALKKKGWYQDYQRGSHIYLRNPGYPGEKITVPDHKEILPKTLKTIISQAYLTTEEFANLVQRS